MIDPNALMESFTRVAATGIKSGLEMGKADRERLERERDELVQTLLDTTNALADSISHTHPYGIIVDQSRRVLAKYSQKEDVNNA